MFPMMAATTLILVLSHFLVPVSATLYNTTCHQIAGAISPASDVYYPSSQQYSADISHFVTSSTQSASCSVEPGTAADVGVILRILGSTRTPFAVKGGGHASNPGFSSTPGVQIAMVRFSETTYDATTQTASIGAGLIWDDVYTTLEPYGVNVVGGRVTGIGVAGFTLGGGYSWKTNQYGLAIDTVQSFELVLPNGTVTTVTATSNADLFFGLRGGFNNFGIVTKFVLKTFPQTQVWGGTITYGNDTFDKITAATNKFSDNNNDPKANIITSYTFSQGQAIISLLVFYDAPTPPSGLFDDFLAIAPLATDISTRPFKSLVQSSAVNATAGFRGAFDTVSLTGYSVDMLNFIVKQLMHVGTSQTLQSTAFIVYAVEPFLPSILSHSTSPSAYPPNRSRGLSPLNLDFGWTDPSMDDAFHKAIRHSAASIKAKAIADGQDVANAALYGNYAISDTPLKDIYGSNLGRLKKIKETYDPRNVMGLAGGFKF